MDHPASASGGVLTDGTKIVALGPDIFNGGRPDDAEIVDCGGAVLAPGLVDMRVDFCEPGNEHKEDIESGSRAAAAGGVTAVVTLPDTEPAIDDASVLEFVARRARDVKLVKVFGYATVTRRATATKSSRWACSGRPARWPSPTGGARWPTPRPCPVRSNTRSPLTR